MSPNEQIAADILHQITAFEAQISEWKQAVENLKLFAGLVYQTPMNYEQLCSTPEQCAEMTAKVQLLSASWQLIAQSVPWVYIVPAGGWEAISPRFEQLLRTLEYDYPHHLQQRIESERRRVESERIQQEEAARLQAEEDAAFEAKLTRLGFQKPTAEGE